MEYILICLSIILFVFFEYQVASLLLNPRDKKSNRVYLFLVLYVAIRVYLYFNTQPPLQRALIMLSLVYIFNTVLFKDTFLKKLLSLCLIIIFMIPLELLIITVVKYFNINAGDMMYYMIQIAIVLIGIQLMRIIRPWVTNKKIVIKRRHKVYALTIALMLLVLMIFFLLSGYDLSENVSIERFDLDYGHMGYFITMALVIGILLIMNRKLMKIQEQQTKEKIYYQQKEGYRHQLKLARINEKKIRQLKHDYRNHLSSIRYLIEKGENQKANNYIGKMEDFLIVEGEHINTGEALDSILNYKIQEAKEKQIEVNLDADIHEPIKISEFDLTVVLGNLMDNAIEALEKIHESAPINLKIKIKKGVIGIQMSNLYNGDITIKDGFIKTNKKDSALHGNGLNHIREIVHAYDGFLDIAYDNKSFNVKIMMYNN